MGASAGRRVFSSVLVLLTLLCCVRVGCAAETVAGKPEKLTDTVSILIAGDLIATPHLLLASTRAIATQVLPNGIQSLDVVVVDTGASSGKHLVPSAVGEEDLHALVNANGKLPAYATVRYHHLAYASLSEARQYGLTLTIGAYIVLWDLFSVHSPNRLQTQVTPLISEQVRPLVNIMMLVCAHVIGIVLLVSNAGRRHDPRSPHVVRRVRQHVLRRDNHDKVHGIRCCGSAWRV